MATEEIIHFGFNNPRQTQRLSGFLLTKCILMNNIIITMLQNYILKYLSKAKYEMIDNGKRFYAEIRELRGVWAVGKTLEECRENLTNTMEGWLILRLRKNLEIPNFKIPSFPISISQYA